MQLLVFGSDSIHWLWEIVVRQVPKTVKTELLFQFVSLLISLLISSFIGWYSRCCLDLKIHGNSC